MLLLIFLIALILSSGIGLLAYRPSAPAGVSQRTLQLMSVRSPETHVLDAATPETRTFATQFEAYVTRFRFARSLDLLIQHSAAGTSVSSVVAVSIASAVAAAFLAHVFVGNLVVDLIASLIGTGWRWGLLKFQKSRRVNKFNDGLVDVIELIARALRAGHSIGSAIEIVSEQSPEPLRAEFGEVFRQQKFGIPFREAIVSLGERVPSKDLHFLITAMLVQKETGGDLTEVLDRTARVIRERIRIHGEIKTYTAQGRLTGWILAALPVVMLVLINIVTPGYSDILFHDPTGQLLLYAAGGLILVGGFIISKIVDIQV